MSTIRYLEEKYTEKEKLIRRLRKEPVSVTDPSLISEWLPDSFGPECFSRGSIRLVWWLCEKGHYFNRAVCRRTRALDCNSKSKGCPFCSGRMSAAAQGLARLLPALAQEWDGETNGPCDLISTESRRTVCWRCPRGHAYASMVLARTREGQSCPVCDAGERVDVSTVLAKARIQFVQSCGDHFGPAPALNFGHTPKSLAINHKVWWTCTANAPHLFYRSAAQLRETGFACPQCQRRFAGNLVEYPHLVDQFHPTLNGRLNPQSLPAGSDKIIWWLCKKHPTLPWRAQVSNRTLRGAGCPECLKTGATDINSLSTNHPRIASEWHPTRNGTIKPAEIFSTSQESFWWLCSCGCEYYQQVYSRVLGAGCFKCKVKDSGESVRHRSRIFETIVTQTIAPINITVIPTDSQHTVSTEL